MKQITNQEMSILIDKALSGDKESLESIILSVQDLIFNLSLRMLGTFADAEDAAQDIILKIITNLSSFKKQSSFTTWVFSIASNHLKNYKKHMFAHMPLSFEYYRNDIKAGICMIFLTWQNVEKAILADELKMSCTNVMLQCLDAESRCIFILGTMFKLDSRIAGEVLGLTPEAYRQRLSRIRKKMASFLEKYCGEYGYGKCKCINRLNYAIQNHRLDPAQLDYTTADVISDQTIIDVKDTMEQIDDLSQEFSFCKSYKSPERTKKFIKDFLNSAQFSIIKDA